MVCTVGMKIGPSLKNGWFIDENSFWSVYLSQFFKTDHYVYGISIPPFLFATLNFITKQDTSYKDKDLGVSDEVPLYHGIMVKKTN